MASVDEPGIASVLLQASDRTGELYAIRKVHQLHVYNAGQYSDQGEQTSSYRTFSKNSNRDTQSDNLSETELVTNAKVQVLVLKGTVVVLCILIVPGEAPGLMGTMRLQCSFFPNLAFYW